MSIPPIYIPEVKGSEVVYKGFFDVRVDLIQLPHGPKKEYCVVQTGPEAAAILAETSDGKLILLKEYRHPTKKWLLGCPGGRIDPGESPFEAAKRELLEETGFKSEEFVFMGAVYPHPAVADQRIHYILAKNATYAQAPELEPFELIHVELKTKQQIYAEIASGVPVDGVLCTALFLRSLLL